MSNQHKDKVWVYSKDIEGKHPAPGVTRKVLAYCDALMCTENQFEEGTVAAMHSHPHTQIAYAVSGRFRFTVGDEEQEIAQGDTVYIPGGVQHGALCLEAGIVVDFFTPLREDFI